MIRWHHAYYLQLLKLFKFNNRMSMFISPLTRRQSNMKYECGQCHANRSSSEQNKEWWTVLCQLVSWVGWGELGVVFLDFLGDAGVSSTFNWSLSLFGFALGTRSSYLQVINNSLYLRGFRRTVHGEDHGTLKGRTWDSHIWTRTYSTFCCVTSMVRGGIFSEPELTFLRMSAPVATNV